jgi:hypothetical protein
MRTGLPAFGLPEDWSACGGNGCGVKEGCLRYHTYLNSQYPGQVYFDPYPYLVADGCEYFLAIPPDEPS